jgi:RecA-family ATPase
MSNTVVKVRLALKAAGFDPVACTGKRPIQNEWQLNNDFTPEQIRRMGGNNTGVLTQRTPALDTDIDAPEPASRVEEIARDWFDGRGVIPTRFGRAPRRALLFRTASPFNKIVAKFRAPDGSKHKIEFLGDGQQVVVHGTHPDTNAPYSWHGDISPWAMQHADLVEIDEAEAHAFLDFVADTLKEEFGFERVTDGNGHDTHVPLPDGNSDFSALDTASKADAGGITNEVQCHLIPHFLRLGEHPHDVLVRVVVETMAHAGTRLGWNETEEVKCVVRRILSAYRNLLLKDYDPASGAIPDWLPGEFHEGWLRVLAAGGRPMLHFNRAGFCVKSVWQSTPNSKEHTTQTDSTGAKTQEQPTAKADTDKEPRNKKEPPTRRPIHAIPFKAFDEAKLPPREWLYAGHYQRGQVTATIGPGGAGKSSVDLVEGLAMATARDLLGEQPTQRCRVWIHNGDDDGEEMKRRIAAVCRHYQIPMAELEGWLFTTTKVDFEIKLGTGNGTLTINRAAIDAIVSTILANQIDVCIFEPLITLHNVPENNNQQMNQIVHLLSGIADGCDCAIDICQHTRKLLAGNEEYSTDDSRGASAIRDAVRGSRVLNTLTRDQAREAGIEEQERAFYFRVDRGKANYLPPAKKATWRKFENVELLNGDHVGVVAVWEYPGQGVETPAKTTAERAAENLFMTLLARFALQGRNVSDRSGVNYAPLLFSREGEAKAAKIGKEALAGAMRRLFAKGRIRADDTGSGGHRVHCIMPT